MPGNGAHHLDKTLHWRYIFAPVGLDPTTAQWIRWLLPERFAVDDEWRVAKKNAALEQR